MHTTLLGPASTLETKKAKRRAARATSLRAMVATLAAAGVFGVRSPVTAQTITEFTVPTPGCLGQGIPIGPDGALWFTEDCAGKIGRITPGGSIVEYPLPDASANPIDITAGQDGNLWFTESDRYVGNKIGRITPSGIITEYTLPTPSSFPFGIAAGPDGNVWFTEFGGNKIGRITSSGSITEYLIPTPNARSERITAGPAGDQTLWFTETGTRKIGRITTSGSITEYVVPTPECTPYGITAGPDGDDSVWFTEIHAFEPPFTQVCDKIGRITSSGIITEYTLPTPSSFPFGIAAGPDGNVWFTEFSGNKIGRITSSGSITEYVIPSGGSPLGIAAGPDGNIWFTTWSGRIGRVNLTPPPPPECVTCPPAGSDSFDTTAVVTLDIPLLGLRDVVTLTGPTTIQRGDPVDPGDGRRELLTELVSLGLTGTSPVLGPIRLVQNPTLPSVGGIKASNVGSDFPADSFFDVFFEIETTLAPPFDRLSNAVPLRLYETIGCVPPLGAIYQPVPGGDRVAIYDSEDNQVASLIHAQHEVVSSLCGDGVVESFEACDDGNTIDCDGCDRNCTTTGCGNGVECAPEQCDDGNTSAGDGCSPTCSLEPKRVICIDAGPACAAENDPKCCIDPAMNNYEGYYVTHPQAGDITRKTSDLGTCLKDVRSGDTVIIAAHGAPGEFKFGDVRYAGFSLNGSAGTNRPPCPGPNNTTECEPFRLRTDFPTENVSVRLNICFSEDGAESVVSVAQSLRVALGSAAQVTGMSQLGCSFVLPSVERYGTPEQNAAADQCVKDAAARAGFPEKPPGDASIAMWLASKCPGTAAMELQDAIDLDSCPGAGGVVLMKPVYAEPYPGSTCSRVRALDDAVTGGGAAPNDAPTASRDLLFTSQPMSLCDMGCRSLDQIKAPSKRIKYAAKCNELLLRYGTAAATKRPCMLVSDSQLRGYVEEGCAFGRVGDLLQVAYGANDHTQLPSAGVQADPINDDLVKCQTAVGRQIAKAFKKTMTACIKGDPFSDVTESLTRQFERRCSALTPVVDANTATLIPDVGGGCGALVGAGVPVSPEDLAACISSEVGAARSGICLVQ